MYEGKVYDHLFLFFYSFIVITEQVQAILGGTAELPCDLSVVPGDKIRLVLWSNNNNTVIYRFVVFHFLPLVILFLLCICTCICILSTFTSYILYSTFFLHVLNKTLTL